MDMPNRSYERDYLERRGVARAGHMPSGGRVGFRQVDDREVVLDYSQSWTGWMRDKVKMYPNFVGPDTQAIPDNLLEARGSNVGYLDDGEYYYYRGIMTPETRIDTHVLARPGQLAIEVVPKFPGSNLLAVLQEVESFLKSREVMGRLDGGYTQIEYLELVVDYLKKHYGNAGEEVGIGYEDSEKFNGDSRSEYLVALPIEVTRVGMPQNQFALLTAYIIEALVSRSTGFLDSRVNLNGKISGNGRLKLGVFYDGVELNIDGSAQLLPGEVGFTDWLAPVERRQPLQSWEDWLIHVVNKRPDYTDPKWLEPVDRLPLGVVGKGCSTSRIGYLNKEHYPILCQGGRIEGSIVVRPHRADIIVREFEGNITYGAYQEVCARLGSAIMNETRRSPLEAVEQAKIVHDAVRFMLERYGNAGNRPVPSYAKQEGRGGRFVLEAIPKSVTEIGMPQNQFALLLAFVLERLHDHHPNSVGGDVSVDGKIGEDGLLRLEVYYNGQKLDIGDDDAEAITGVVSAGQARRAERVARSDSAVAERTRYLRGNWGVWLNSYAQERDGFRSNSATVVDGKLPIIYSPYGYLENGDLPIMGSMTRVQNHALVRPNNQPDIVVQRDKGDIESAVREVQIYFAGYIRDRSKWNEKDGVKTIVDHLIKVYGNAGQQTINSELLHERSENSFYLTAIRKGRSGVGLPQNHFALLVGYVLERLGEEYPDLISNRVELDGAIEGDKLKLAVLYGGEKVDIGDVENVSKTQLTARAAGTGRKTDGRMTSVPVRSSGNGAGDSQNIDLTGPIQERVVPKQQRVRAPEMGVRELFNYNELVAERKVLPLARLSTDTEQYIVGVGAEERLVLVPTNKRVVGIAELYSESGKICTLDDYTQLSADGEDDSFAFRVRPMAVEGVSADGGGNEAGDLSVPAADLLRRLVSSYEVKSLPYQQDGRQLSWPVIMLSFADNTDLFLGVVDEKRSLRPFSKPPEVQRDELSRAVLYSLVQTNENVREFIYSQEAWAKEGGVPIESPWQVAVANAEERGRQAAELAMAEAKAKVNRVRDLFIDLKRDDFVDTAVKESLAKEDVMQLEAITEFHNRLFGPTDVEGRKMTAEEVSDMCKRVVESVDLG